MFFSIITAPAEETLRNKSAPNCTELLSQAIARAGCSQKEIAIATEMSFGHLSRLLKSDGNFLVRQLDHLPERVLQEFVMLLGDKVGLQVVPSDEQIESRVEQAQSVLLELTQLMNRKARAPKR